MTSRRPPPISRSLLLTSRSRLSSRLFTRRRRSDTRRRTCCVPPGCRCSTCRTCTSAATWRRSQRVNRFHPSCWCEVTCFRVYRFISPTVTTECAPATIPTRTPTFRAAWSQRGDRRHARACVCALGCAHWRRNDSALRPSLKASSRRSAWCRGGRCFH